MLPEFRCEWQRFSAAGLGCLDRSVVWEGGERVVCQLSGKIYLSSNI